MKRHVQIITDAYVDEHTFELVSNANINDRDGLSAVNPEVFGAVLRNMAEGTLNGIFQAYPVPPIPTEGLTFEEMMDGLNEDDEIPDRDDLDEPVDFD